MRRSEERRMRIRVWKKMRRKMRVKAEVRDEDGDKDEDKNSGEEEGEGEGKDWTSMTVCWATESESRERKAARKVLTMVAEDWIMEAIHASWALRAEGG